MNCFTGYMKVAGCSEWKINSIERTGSWMTCIHNYGHDAPLSISNHTLAPLYASIPLSYMSPPPPLPFLQDLIGNSLQLLLCTTTPQGSLWTPTETPPKESKSHFLLQCEFFLDLCRSLGVHEYYTTLAQV